MKKFGFFKKVNKPIINATLVGIVMLTILAMVLLYTSDRERQKKSMELTNNFVGFQNNVQNFIINNSILIDGFSAYVESFEIESDKAVYTYLANLLKDRMYYIKNVGIIKDTTVLWNYPLEGNKQAIGTDLSKIPAQKASIIKAKETLESSFDGPVDLVQGGKGYIIRKPMTKGGKYWGLASIVLYSDKVDALFDTYAKKFHIKVAIFNKNDSKNLVYGDKNIKNQKPMIFRDSFIYNDWVIYVLPEANTNNSKQGLLLIIGITGLILTSIVTLKSYEFFKSLDDIKRKNIILKKSSVKDKLTEIYNRSYLDVILVEEIKLANRNSSNLSLIYFDIDHYKAINDNHGHTAGDTVLKEIATLVKGYIRNNDIFARWGGDEFVIIMPNTSLKGALIVAEKIRSAIEEYNYLVAEKITASFGVAEHENGETPVHLFDRVDKALYFAKKSGRNAVCTISIEGTLTCH